MNASPFLLSFLFLSTLAFSQDGEFRLDKDFPMNSNGKIDLTASDAKVFITGSSRKTAHVKIFRKVTIKGFHTSNDEFRVDIEPENGNLKIKEYSKSFSAGLITYYKEEYKIEIEAPEGSSLVIRGDDGDYYVQNVNGSIDMSLDDADAELVDCRGDKFSIRLDDGDFRMNTGKGSLELDGDDGDFEVQNGSFSSVIADVDDGDLIIETSLADNGRYDITSQDGLVDVTITGGGGEFDVRYDDGHVTSDGNYKISYESEERTRLSLGSGSARVTVRGEDARVRLSSRN
jgi:hypothetical protein